MLKKLLCQYYLIAHFKGNCKITLRYIYIYIILESNTYLLLDGDKLGLFCVFMI